MKTLALYIIAACLFAQTFGIYKADTGGIDIWFGNLGYHMESE